MCGRQFTRSDLRKKHELLHERATPARAVSKARRVSRSTSIRKDILPSHIEPNLEVLTCADEQGADQLMSDEVINAIQQAQARTASIEESLVQEAWGDQVDLNPYFDYTSFARPWNYSFDHAAQASDWLSSQFFAALRETDLAYSPPFQTWTTADNGSVNSDVLCAPEYRNLRHSSHYLFGESANLRPSGNEMSQHAEVILPLEVDMRIRPGQMSRIASPPNESSHEDRLPFAWDPRSKPIARAKPIILADDDPIFTSVDQTVQIEHATLMRIQAFLRPRDKPHGEETFTLPSLPLVNVFVSLFFSRFLPHAPVLHRPTLTMDTLPPALLAIIMVIG